MFFRHLNKDIQLSLSIPQYAEELFLLTDRNRAFLKQWLPWLDTITKPSDTKDFIAAQLLRFQQGKALHITIFYQDKIAGVLGYNEIDQVNGIGYAGYWLGLPLILVGGMKSLEVAAEILGEGSADYISMSRAFIREPDLILRWQKGDLRPAQCKSDNLCFTPGFEGKGVSCLSKKLEKTKISAYNIKIKNEYS